MTLEDRIKKIKKMFDILTGKDNETCKDSLTIPEWKNGCIEETIILDESKEVYTYSLSNSLDCIIMAIYSRTRHNVDMKEALWRLNTRLSVSVKHIMNVHNVNFSMTTGIRGEVKFLVVNMRVGDNWFITGYNEINGNIYNW